MNFHTHARWLLAASTSAVVALCAVHNAGAQQPQVWRLTEDLRIGGAGDGGPKTFAEVRGIVATKGGNIFVIEFKALEVRMFDAKGAFVRVVARKGSGPGEVAFPNGLAIGDDDVVVVSDAGNARFSFYSPDGRFLKQVGIPMNGFGDFWKGVVEPAGRIVDLPVRVRTGGIDPRTNYPRTEDRIRRIGADGKADTVAFPQCAPDVPTLVYKLPSGNATSLEMPFFAHEQEVVTRKGTVWCTPGGEYRLLTAPFGKPLVEVVRKTVPAPVVTAQERSDAIKGFDGFAAKINGKLTSGDPNSLPHTKAIISELFADDQGRAWARRTDVPNVVTALDVFDAAGRDVATIRSTSPIGHVVFIAGDKLYTVIMDANDEPIVVRYRIER